MPSGFGETVLQTATCGSLSFLKMLKLGEQKAEMNGRGTIDAFVFLQFLSKWQ
jgi:hypothetical protein